MMGREWLNRRAFLGAAIATAATGQPLCSPSRRRAKRRSIRLIIRSTKPVSGHCTSATNRRASSRWTDSIKVVSAKQVVWYMWYQVYNLAPAGRTAEPVTFLPEFELVTKDLNTSHLDEPQPFIFEQVRKLEDTTVGPDFPNGILDLQNTISISKKPIPPSKPDAIPRMVSGLAIWTDMDEVAPKTNKFSVYISGLSNGLGNRGNAYRPEAH